MGIHKLPSFEDYWEQHTRLDSIASCMSRDRFMTIRNYLHFADNNYVNFEDRFFKIRPIFELVVTAFMRFKAHDNVYSVDETIVPYKGTYAGNLRQYNPKKPTKWGFKIISLADASGQIYCMILLFIII